MKQPLVLAGETKAGGDDRTTTPYFAFGSNSVQQLRERCQNPLLEARKAFLPGYRRIFAGTSKKWGGGGVASLSASQQPPARCIGSAVDLTEAELQLLDRFEGIPASTAKAKAMPVDPYSADPERNRYRRVAVELVSVDDKTGAETREQGIAYIRNSSTWESFPSDAYLSACHSNLLPFWGPEIDGSGALHVFDESAQLRGKWMPPADDGGGKTATVFGPGSSPAWPLPSSVVVSTGAPLGLPSSVSYLSQVADVKAFADAASHRAASVSSAGAGTGAAQGERVPVWVCLGLYEFSNVDLLAAQYYCRVRVYSFWPVDLHAHGLGVFADRAVEAGEHIKLAAEEMEEVSAALTPMPLLTVYNMLDEAELDSLDMRVYSLGRGRTAIMANAMYGFTCKQHFKLKDFPFDTQELVLDVRFVNSKLWATYDLMVHGVQFQEASLNMSEYTVCEPSCVHLSSKTTQVFFPLKRKAAFYLRNVVGIMLPLTFISVLSMACAIDDVSGRLGTVLTVLLTAVAFKLILADKLPAVSYSTSIDTFIELNMAVLFLTTFLCVIPEQVRHISGAVAAADGNITAEDAAEAHAILVNRALTGVSLFIIIIGNLLWLAISYRHAQNDSRVLHSGARASKPVVCADTGSSFTYFAFSDPPFVLRPGGAAEGTPQQGAVGLRTPR